MKIGGALLAPFHNDKERNKSKVIHAFKEASSTDVQLLVFPEMTLSGFTMDHALYDQSDIQFFKALAKKYGVAVLFGSIFKKGNDFFNAAIFYDPKRHQSAVYFKRRLFNYANEDTFYCEGKSSIQFSFQSLKCSVLVCYDLRFPELFRDVKGAELFFVIANWPKSRELHWNTLLRARAIENQAFVIGVNRTGFDANGVDYGQLNIAFDYFGNKLFPTKTSQLSIWEISTEMLKKMNQWREAFPVLKK